MRRIDTFIAAPLAIAALMLLDHFRIHGYWYDAHDLLLRTDSGLGFDSHEFFIMTAIAAATVLGVFRSLDRTTKNGSAGYPVEKRADGPGNVLP